LILVMTLLVIAASLIGPSLSSFMRGRSLDSEARRLLSLARAAQSRAVSEGTPMLLWINTPHGSYGVEREATSKQNDPKALGFSVDGSVQVAVVNPASAGTRLRNLPTIRFLADGSIDENSPQTLRLNDTDGATLWLVQTRNRMGYEIRSTNK
jgi:Tfp pilus assembly protein FimT